MRNEITLSGIHLEERHPVDDALGCMIPAALLGGITLFGLLNLLKLFF
jgi:hypothetical protein